MSLAPSSSSLQTMSASEFVRRIRAKADQTDQHFVVWLGAGCSVSSGIPAASALVREYWLPQLHQLRTGGGDIDAWIKAEFPDYDAADAGAFYGTVMNERFPLPDDRQRETERLCTNREPGFGYAVLASLMSRDDGILSTALTTNFDDLVADAMYVFGERRPLVIEHDALAGFARPGRVRRPLVVKVHGDHRLNPMHTKSETSVLKESVADGIRGLLQDRGVIFIGYSGNDRGVVEALEALPEEALPYGVWWVSRTEPTGKIRSWLDARHAIWVRAGTFDELMLLFHQEFGFDHPTADKFDRMVDSYRTTYKTLTDSVSRLADSEPDSAQLKRAARRADDAATDWWGVDLEASRYIDDDPDRADAIYRDGIARIVDATLLKRYGFFLSIYRNETDRAEEMYRRALAIDPSHVETLIEYAYLLVCARRNDEADALYQRARTAAPSNTLVLGVYASFLAYARKAHDLAQELYEAALAEPDPDPLTISSYAGFLLIVRGQHRSLALQLIERALEEIPLNPYILRNAARAMIFVDDDTRARALIDRGLSNLDRQFAQIHAELWFYVLAMGWNERRDEALQQLAILLSPNRRRLLGWILESVLERAARDEHPDLPWLKLLAAVIIGDEQPAVLDGWADWPSPASDES